MEITNACRIFVIGNYILFLLSTIDSNSDCNLVSSSSHQISPKDFKVHTLYSKYVMCSAYYCSQNRTLYPLKLTVHEINSTKGNLAIHLDQKSISSLKKCHPCPEISKLDDGESNQTECKTCPEIEPSKFVEIHVRLDKSKDSNNSKDECIWESNFNMSIQEFTCKEGLSANIPKDRHCNVSFDSNVELTCIKPTCSEDVLLKSSGEVLIQKFMPMNHTNICIWNFKVDSSDTVDITFSPHIKKYLTVFEEDTLKPRWDLSKCSNHTSHLRIIPNSRNILILYRNMESLLLESLLRVNISKSKSLCPLPSIIDNGKVDFHLSENGTIASYSCFENFSLKGTSQIDCHSEQYDPPICIKEKGYLVSDEPEIIRSNISLIELDQGILESTKLSPVYETSTSIPTEGEGSGNSHSEDEESYLDIPHLPDEDPSSVLNSTFYNTSVSRNGSLTPPSNSNDDELGSLDENLVLFSFPDLEDKMMMIIIISVGALLIVIIAIISLIVCRNRSARSGPNNKFDPFQNPIYEKPVIRVPIPSTEADPCREKLDLGDLSDSTTLD